MKTKTSIRVNIQLFTGYSHRPGFYASLRSVSQGESFDESTSQPLCFHYFHLENNSLLSFGWGFILCRQLQFGFAGGHTEYTANCLLRFPDGGHRFCTQQKSRPLNKEVTHSIWLLQIGTSVVDGRGNSLCHPRSCIHPINSRFFIGISAFSRKYSLTWTKNMAKEQSVEKLLINSACIESFYPAD